MCRVAFPRLMYELGHSQASQQQLCYYIESKYIILLSFTQRLLRMCVWLQEGGRVRLSWESTVVSAGTYHVCTQALLSLYLPS